MVYTSGGINVGFCRQSYAKFCNISQNLAWNFWFWERNLVELLVTAALTHTAACVGFEGWALAAVGVECIVR
jgi:hypothetical protein